MLIRSAIQEAFPFPNDIDPSRACLYFPPVSTLCPIIDADLPPLLFRSSLKYYPTGDKAEILSCSIYLTMIDRSFDSTLAK